ncbi:YeeE/YedE family protein [Echinimonas agarilytica]|uniref:YeeE/YedE family protein n=1 Tax=Echinimonas agarilytica TaxID=1215918 RepID=A0AA42B6E7_9GAMM|nr:YeeE/YedE family protein [Echinimonas agarilytica]MCM2678356.1 YeeE/YedE family protein [Echinimonas agarilytica]
MTHLISLISGVLFGIGLTISGMVNPDKVIGFLDVTGHWDPSLAFVMGGALMIYLPGYWFYGRHQNQAISGGNMQWPQSQRIDRKLILGATLFGLGWGLVGLCPGPALSSLLSGNPSIGLFVVSMFIGFALAKWKQA